MSEDRDLGIGVVGAGFWGKNLVRNFAHTKGARLIAVADLVEAHLQRAQNLVPGVICTPNFDDLLENKDIGAIAVVTEAATHHRMAKAALLADKDVYVEKPLTLTVQDAQELVTLAAERERILMVGHLMLFHPAMRWIKERLDAGEFGDLHYLYCQRLNLGVVRRDESAWWSLAPHDISILLYLLNELPRDISARGHSYLRSDIEDVVFANLRCASGQAAEVHTSWLDPHKIRKLTLVCSGKMITFDDSQPVEKIRVYDKGAERSVDYNTFAELISLRQGDIWIPSFAMTEPLLVECQHFVDCVRERRRPDTPGEQGLEVVRILQAGQRSIGLGGAPVTLR